MHIDRFKDFIGFGIAGNFAHHLEQAGEANDFIDVKVEEANAPKGIFPFYLPKSPSFLGIYPLSDATIIHPKVDNGNLQMEPEVGLLCNIIYIDNKVSDIVPTSFGAYNDCTIRKEGAKKISEKKNWGIQTKGFSSNLIPIDKFERGGVMDSYHIASFLKRDGKLYAYGEDSPVLTYNYFYGKLKKWIINKLNTQKDNGPLENLNEHLQSSNYPTQMIISIGATSYTTFGESTFLEIGDEVFVYIYDSYIYSYDQIYTHTLDAQPKQLENCSLLYQKVLLRE